MARRRGYSRTRTIYRKARGGYRSRKGLLSGSLKSVLIGAVAGAVSNFIPDLPYVGKYTKPVVLGAGGYILKKPELMTCAGYELGKSLMGGNGNGNAIQSSFFEG